MNQKVKKRLMNLGPKVKKTLTRRMRPRMNVVMWISIWIGNS
ncbi:hypothetical protein BVRB_5g099280 [Beta vulgaris subsp. vulgaris]|nr:hypothetical protein BVRB_5g099280 [Beta vulgaris subsp. vulgaris]